MNAKKSPGRPRMAESAKTVKKNITTQAGEWEEWERVATALGLDRGVSGLIGLCTNLLKDELARLSVQAAARGVTLQQHVKKMLG